MESQLESESRAKVLTISSGSGLFKVALACTEASLPHQVSTRLDLILVV